MLMPGIIIYECIVIETWLTKRYCFLSAIIAVLVSDIRGYTVYAYRYVCESQTTRLVVCGVNIYIIK